MTDIYDFRDPKFKEHSEVWNKIHTIIYRFYQIKGGGRSNSQIFKFFKNNSPEIFENCSEEIIKSFILQSSQISYHEIVVIPKKKKKEIENSLGVEELN